MAGKKEKYQQLFEESLKLFSILGYKKTTIEDIAQQLQMTKGNLYFYVKNKKDLYHKTISWALTQWQSHVIAAVEQENDPQKKFKVMAKTAMAYIGSNGYLQNLLIKDPGILTLDKEKDRFPEINQAARGIISDILDQGFREKIFTAKDPGATTEYLFRVYMMFLIQTYVFLDQDAFQQMFDAALELNLRGLTNGSLFKH